VGEKTGYSASNGDWKGEDLFILFIWEGRVHRLSTIYSMKSTIYFMKINMTNNTRRTIFYCENASILEEPSILEEHNHQYLFKEECRAPRKLGVNSVSAKWTAVLY
jgi:hypothetical protein